MTAITWLWGLPMDRAKGRFARKPIPIVPHWCLASLPSSAESQVINRSSWFQDGGKCGMEYLSNRSIIIAIEGTLRNKAGAGTYPLINFA